MARYSAERREAVLKKLLPPYNRSVPEVSREEGISEPTLYNWLKRCKSEGMLVPHSGKNTDDWPVEARFAAVMETASFSEVELSQYCRERGLYPEQIKQWKADCMTAMQGSKASAAELKRQRNADKKKIRELEKELRRKDKALAETAALLVMRKKLNALYGVEEEDD